MEQDPPSLPPNKNRMLREAKSGTWQLPENHFGWPPFDGGLQVTPLCRCPSHWHVLPLYSEEIKAAGVLSGCANVPGCICAAQQVFCVK